jgi:DNA-binding response OmpR family regulator
MSQTENLIMKKNKILLVEDDKNITFTISIYLENTGLSIISAENGEEAIIILEQNQDIDMVITDINMPVMDGITFCKYIREKPEYNLLPVLILTASTEQNTKYMGFKAGTDDYITKPFDPIELLLRINALLRRKAVIQSITEKPDDPQKEFEDKLLSNANLEINGKKVNFTNKEFDVFYYLYMNNSRYVTSEELLDKVMEYPKWTGNPEIIRTHIKNIRVKIEEDFHNPQIIKTSTRRGYYMDISKIN